MSRFTKTMNDGKIVAYGFDHAIGYFIDVFEPAVLVDELLMEEEVVLEKCSRFGSSNGDILQIMEEYGVDKDHCRAVVLDLEF